MPDYLLIDAMQLDVLIEQKSLIKGDARSVSIAAASILAKTHRDCRMEEWDAVYPQYGLAQHKGYGTPDHLEALRLHGPTPLHRHSFAPVRDAGCWAAGAVQEALPLEIWPRTERRVSSRTASSPQNFRSLPKTIIRHFFAQSGVSATGITACSQSPALSLTPQPTERSVKK